MYNEYYQCHRAEFRRLFNVKRITRSNVAESLESLGYRDLEYSGLDCNYSIGKYIDDDSTYTVHVCASLDALIEWSVCERLCLHC